MKKEERTLLIMAGGLGSRFGGLKQVEPVDEFNNFIIDYSVFDCIRAGFNKVVFVIKKENYDVFKSTIGKRVEKHIKVDYAFQGMEDYVPSSLANIDRQKPWGTGHAVLCAKDKIDGDFAVINADDFYGYDGFRVASKFFDENKSNDLYALVGYEAGNTITDNGAVKRGVCEVSNGFFVDVKESSVEKINGRIYATELGTDDTREIGASTLVSMNLLCFRKNFFDVLEKKFRDFLFDKNTNLQKDEFLILNQVPHAFQMLGVKMKVLSTSAVWYGFTYKEDKEKVVEAIKKMRESGEYPVDLWRK